MAAVTAPLTGSTNHLRPFNSSRDLKSAADLVDLCFSATLDPDGQSYLRHLRETASGLPFFGLEKLWGMSSLPPVGYVWEEEQRLVGYLSVIPFIFRNQRRYLIANVAVHPDWRGRGIGKALTHRAIEHAREHHAHSAWLQVRDDNAPAVHIYQALGFLERARRTTWISESLQEKDVAETGEQVVSISKRHTWHWDLQRRWLDRIYPLNLSWHIPFDRRVIEPGFVGGLYRFFTFVYPRHWVAQYKNKICGILTCLPTDGYADGLWLAAPGEENTLPDEACQTAIRTLLIHARKTVSPLRPLSLNYPAGLWVDPIQAAGFHLQQTLIWMEYPLG